MKHRFIKVEISDPYPPKLKFYPRLEKKIGVLNPSLHVSTFFLNFSVSVLAKNFKNGAGPEAGPPQAKILTFGLISDGWDTIW